MLPAPAVSRWIRRTAPLILLAAIPGCQAPATTSPSFVQGFSVTPDALTLTVGSTMTLDAHATNDAGDRITVPGVFWSTSDAAVASVGNRGLVTARGAGQARIAATAGGRSAVSSVTVITLVVPSIP
jgi:uncharacterized protein YjdB